MPPPPNHEIVHVAAAAFGIASAMLIFGGLFFLRAQRNRFRFLIMKSAIERGVTPMREGPPFWLLSLRQGVSTFVLGVAMMIIGVVLIGASRHVTMPSQASITPTSQPSADARQLDDDMQPAAPPPPNIDNASDQQRPDAQMPNGPRPDMGPGGPEGRPDGGPDGGPDRFDFRGHDLRPPVPNLLLDQWRRAEAQKSIGGILGGVGFVLTLLGFVRILFAGAERRHTPIPFTTATGPGMSPNMPPHGM